MITKFKEFIVEKVENIKYTIIPLNEEDESIQVIAKHNNKQIGKLYMELETNMYWYFEDDFTEDEYDEMFPDDELVNLQSVDVIDEYKNQGISRELINRGLEECKKLNIKRVYLNACPIGTRGLNLRRLLEYYKTFGFEEILDQSNNVQMVLKLN